MKCRVKGHIKERDANTSVFVFLFCFCCCEDADVKLGLGPRDLICVGSNANAVEILLLEEAPMVDFADEFDPFMYMVP